MIFYASNTKVYSEYQVRTEPRNAANFNLASPDNIRRAKMSAVLFIEKREKRE